MPAASPAHPTPAPEPAAGQQGVHTTAHAPAPTSGLTPRRFFRIVAIAEAITWTLLIAGMILKYGFDAGPLPVKIGGGIHGFVFIAYALTVVVVGLNQRWRPGLTVLGVITAVVPYATIPFDVRVDRSGLLDGDWRTTATDDPRDHTPLGRVLRWLLTHPVMFVGLLIAAAVVIMSVLLFLGPPGTWGK